MPPSSATVSSSCGGSSLPISFWGPANGGAAPAPYKRFAAGKTLAQGQFTWPEHVKSSRAPARQMPCGTMREAAKMLEFEYAVILRDRIIKLRGE